MSNPLTEERVKKILSAAEVISKHPGLDLFVSDKPPMRGCKYLGTIPSKAFNPARWSHVNELSPLLVEFYAMLDDYLIGNRGGHTEVYYELENHDACFVRVLEQDSFGPLRCGFFSRIGKWYCVYG